MNHNARTSESDLHQYSCRECDEVITNPLCPGCVARGVEQWALIWMPELIPRLQIGQSFGTGTHCIICNRDMGVCAHCYSKEIYEMIMQAVPELGEEFLQSFNFELRETLN